MKDKNKESKEKDRLKAILPFLGAVIALVVVLFFIKGVKFIAALHPFAILVIIVSIIVIYRNSHARSE